MFDFAWSEIALVGIVALVAIGPKDLPVAIKTIAQMIKKARRMAGEFQTHVDEMVREANLHEVRDQFNEIRRMDIKSQLLKAVDDDGTIRKTLSEPVMDFSPPPPPVSVHDTEALEAPEAIDVAEHPAPAPAADIASDEPDETIFGAPAFVPPNFAPAHVAPARVPPAFVPPAFAPAATTPEHA